MRFISSILLIVLMGISVFIATVHAQPTGIIYASGAMGITNNAVGTASNPSRAVGPNTNKQEVVLRNGTGTAWLHLNFPTSTSAPVSYPATVFIRTDLAAINLGGDVRIQAFTNNSYNTTGLISSTSVRSFYVEDGSAYLAITIPSAFQSIRINLDKPLLSVSEIKVYHAFYNQSIPATNNPFSFNGFTAADCGQPNLTSTQDAEPLLAVGKFMVTNPNRAVDGDTISYSSFTTNGLSLGESQMKQTFYFNSYSNSSDAIRIVISRSGSLLALNLVNNVFLKAYNGEALVSATQLAAPLLDIGLLGLINSNNRATFYFYPKDANNAPFVFDRLEISFNVAILGLGVAANALNIHDVRRVPGAPSVPVTSTVCTNIGSILLAANSALEGIVNNLSFNWYTGLRGGNTLITNKQYTPTGMTATGSRTYYVDVTKPGCPLPSARHQVNLNIVNAPNTPNINLTP